MSNPEEYNFINRQLAKVDTPRKVFVLGSTLIAISLTVVTVLGFWLLNQSLEPNQYPYRQMRDFGGAIACFIGALLLIGGWVFAAVNQFKPRKKRK